MSESITDQNPSRVILVGGGVRSGKSAFAVHLARQMGARRAFVATARAYDPEMEARILRHKQERRDEFHTVEEPLLVPEAVAKIDNVDVVVIDCLTLWLSNLLVRGDTIDMILERVDKLNEVLLQRRFHAIVVTNEVGMSVHPATALGRAFQDLSGWAHQRVARCADEVHLAALGTILRLRPPPIVELRI